MVSDPRGADACNTFVLVCVPTQFEDAHVSKTTPFAGTIDPPLPVTEVDCEFQLYITLPPVEVEMHTPNTTYLYEYKFAALLVGSARIQVRVSGGKTLTGRKKRRTCAQLTNSRRSCPPVRVVVRHGNERMTNVR